MRPSITPDLAVRLGSAAVQRFNQNPNNSSAGKTPAQVGNNRARIGEPLATAGGIRDFQTRYLGLAATAYQIRTVYFIFLCITAFNREL